MSVATDLLADVVRPADPNFDTGFARMILGMKLSESATDQIRKFLLRNNEGTITSEEKSQLDQMLLAGQFIDLLQAKAYLSLQREGVDKQ